MLKKIFNLRLIMMTSAIFIAANMPVYAYGPLMKELHHTVEEAKISISMADEQSGKLTARFIECNGCSPSEYSFDGTTTLINQFGAVRPIKELKTWSGNRAMFHFRKSDNHIEHIKILP